MGSVGLGLGEGMKKIGVNFRMAIYATVIAFVVVILAVSGLAFFEINRIVRPFNTYLPSAVAAFGKSSYQNDLSRLILYDDEVLTQAARNYAFTHNEKWKRTYQALDPELDKCINNAIEIGGNEDKRMFVSVDSANQALDKMESLSFAYIDSGHFAKAIALLESAEYQRQRGLYKRGVERYFLERGNGLKEAIGVSDKVLRDALKSANVSVASSKRWLFFATVFALIAACLIGLMGRRFAQAADALRESEAKSKAIFEGASDAIMLLSHKGFFDCNPATLEMFGFHSKEEFKRMHPADFSPAIQQDGRESLSAAQEHIKIAFEKGRNRFDWVHRRVNGENFPAEVLLSAFDLNGKRVLQATVRDISERKKAESEIRSTRAFLNNVINVIADPVFVKDDKGKFVLVNDAMCAMVGCGREGLLGKDDDEMFPKEQAEVFRKMDANVLNTGIENVNEESLSTLTSGEVRTIITRKTRYTDPAGKKFLVGVIRDFTERKQAEMALQKSEAMLRGIFLAAPVGIIVSKNRVTQSVNERLCEMSGFSHDEMVGKSTRLYFPDDMEFARVGRELYGSYRLGNRRNVEARLRGKDGTLINALLSIAPLDPADPAAGDVVTALDITEIKAYQEKLKKKNSEILEFTNMVTHDLKKPLTTMNIVLGLARKNAFGPLNPDGVDAIDTGIEASKYMQEMLEDLLACAKLETGTQELSLEKTGFKELADEVVGKLKFQIEEKKITVTVPETEISIMTDRKQLTRVLMNLVGNAINYIGSGPDKFIRIGWELKNGTQVFIVADNGIGIPDQSKETLFAKFKRGANVSGVQGTGLGLSIVKGIVEALGGNIWFESEVDKGTTFYFTLVGKR